MFSPLDGTENITKLANYSGLVDDSHGPGGQPRSRMMMIGPRSGRRTADDNEFISAHANRFFCINHTAKYIDKLRHGDCTITVGYMFFRYYY